MINALRQSEVEHGDCVENKDWDSRDQRLKAIKGRTRQLPKPNNRESSETIVQAPPAKRQH